MEPQKTPKQPKQSGEKKTKAGSIMLPDFSLYCKAVWYWQTLHDFYVFYGPEYGILVDVPCELLYCFDLYSSEILAYDFLFM